MITSITCNYNYGQWVQDAIKSAKTQTIPINICVIDDCSTDDSVEKSKIMFDRVPQSSILTINNVPCEIWDDGFNCLISMKRNMGASVARNIGVEYTLKRSDYFLILDADDIALPEKCEKFLRIFKTYPGVGAVYGDYYIDNLVDGVFQEEYKKPYDVLTLSRECIVHSQAMISKHALLDIKRDYGYWDPELHGPRSQAFIGCSEDYDAWLRISQNYMIWHVPELLSIVRVTGKNQSRPENVTAEIWQNNLRRMKFK